MMTFSQRYAGQYGIPATKILQIDSMDETLKTAIWIALEDVFEEVGKDAYKLDSYRAQFRVFLEAIWVISIKRPKSELFGVSEHQIFYSRIKSNFDHYTWDQVYSFLENLAVILEGYRPTLADNFTTDCNHIFTEENSGWRFVNNRVVPITHPIVLEHIENAFIGIGSETAAHLNNMLDEMSKKGEKNYRAVENEALWAVEAFGRELSESKEILSVILADTQLDGFLDHKCFKKMLSSLYGYSGDETRHAIKPASKIPGYTRALFVMHQAVSFINFMKGNKENI